jgi:hypothetical protein
MIDKININQIQDPFDGQSPNQANSAKRVVQEQVDATLQIEFGRIIEQAIKTPPADENAVQRAKELLESGRLDNPANVKEAAKAIVKFGV